MQAKNGQYSIEELLNIMARLRAPEGCPWDIEQTHQSIAKCAAEEAYEFMEAVFRNDIDNMREELGDLLLQVVFHSQMANEKLLFDFSGVVHGIAEKMVRRHPHVFGNSSLSNSDQVQQQWDEIKKEEKAKTGNSITQGLLSDLPSGMSPLLKAHKIGKKCETVGFEWNTVEDVSHKVREELDEVDDEISKGLTSKHLQEELGDLLFSVTQLCRKAGYDAETTLLKANLKFQRRFEQMEGMLQADGKSLIQENAESLEYYWKKVKKSEKG